MNEMPRDPVTKEGEFVQIKKIGDALGLILSEELIERLNLGEGDKFRVVEAAEGAFTLTPVDADYAKAMEIARRSFVTYAETYKALAK
jgi:putative addiction module antidote